MVSVDTTIPRNLIAFLHVGAVGPATGRNSFAVDFIVDSFAVGGRHGRVAVSALGWDPEAVNFTERPHGSCYAGGLTGGISTPLVLRDR